MSTKYCKCGQPVDEPPETARESNMVVECGVCRWRYHPSTEEIDDFRFAGEPDDYEWCCSLCEFERDDVYTYGYDADV